MREHKKDTIVGWRTGGLVAINFSQTSLINWAAGGQNSIAGNSLVSLFANYRKDKDAWDNALDLGYGLLRQGSDDLRKTDDKIDLVSKYGRIAYENWYFAALFNFKTQMMPGYNYPNVDDVISDFLAPAYTLFAAGMDYKPSKDFNLFISPLTGKITTVNNKALSNVGAFGVAPGKMNRAEFGGYIRLLYKTELLENVSIQNKLDLFSNYLEKPKNIDVNWEVLLSMKINQYITASIATHLIYDDDIKIDIDTNKDGIIDKSGPRTQFKEVFAVGFSYKFAKTSKQK